MEKQEWLAEQFESNRTRLRAVAYRMLGSLSEADDAVQESWLHLSRAEATSIENLGGWLTTVVARVCLDTLRSRKSRREEFLDEAVVEPLTNRESEVDPENEILLADSIGMALLVVLEKLSPAERLAFVLHDMFGVSFDEIAPIVGRSATATRQLASRARRRVQGQGTASPLAADLARQREVVTAFLSASRDGNFAALLALLDPQVVFRADPAAARAGGNRELHGAEAVARTFLGRARIADPALINGAIGILVAPGGRLRIALELTFVNEKIVEIRAIAEPEHLSQLDLVWFND